MLTFLLKVYIFMTGFRDPGNWGC